MTVTADLHVPYIFKMKYEKHIQNRSGEELLVPNLSSFSSPQQLKNLFFQACFLDPQRNYTTIYTLHTSNPLLSFIQF